MKRNQDEYAYPEESNEYVQPASISSGYFDYGDKAIEDPCREKKIWEDPNMVIENDANKINE